MRIAFISRPDAGLITSYSGIPFHIVDALRGLGHDVELVSPLQYRASLWLKLKHLLYRKLTSRRFLRDRDPSVLRQYGNEVTSRVAAIKPDLVFSIDTLPFLHAKLPQSVPLVIWGEASFHSCKDFFEMLSGLAPESYRNADAAEGAAYHASDCLIFPSQWAARDAIAHYGVPQRIVRVIPYGANVESDLDENQLHAVLDSRESGPLRLLFVGADWARKGGNKAVTVVRELNSRGIAAELHIVGCRWIDPVVQPFESFIVNHGFIDKSTDAGKHSLNELYRTSTFFVMLSTAETFGIVYAEAAAHGLPSVANDVGGVADAVDRDVTSLLFAPDADVREICDRIALLYLDRPRYRQMCSAALCLYNDRFRWARIRSELSDALDAALSEHSRPPGTDGTAVLPGAYDA